MPLPMHLCGTCNDRYVASLFAKGLFDRMCMCFGALLYRPQVHKSYTIAKHITLLGELWCPPPMDNYTRPNIKMADRGRETEKKSNYFQTIPYVNIQNRVM